MGKLFFVSICVYLFCPFLSQNGLFCDLMAIPKVAEAQPQAAQETAEQIHQKWGENKYVDAFMSSGTLQFLFCAVQNIKVEAFPESAPKCLFYIFPLGVQLIFYVSIFIIVTELSKIFSLKNN